jgi:hypothetical protein
MCRAALRRFYQPLVTNAGKKKNASLDGCLDWAAWCLGQPIRQCDYYCHSRLHALPETDELALDFTLPAFASQRVLQSWWAPVRGHSRLSHGTVRNTVMWNSYDRTIQSRRSYPN